jgi:hypothetical protein
VQGQTERVSSIITVAPTVQSSPVSLLQQQQPLKAAALALQTILDRGGFFQHLTLQSSSSLLLGVFCPQGQTERVSWTIKVAPTVLVKLGPRAVAAALEGGHPRLAQLILDRGGERPPTFKAAAKRGQLTAAVAAGDAAAVTELLQEVRVYVDTCLCI